MDHRLWRSTNKCIYNESKQLNLITHIQGTDIFGRTDRKKIIYIYIYFKTTTIMRQQEKQICNKIPI
jgi:hypothetical protein